MQIIDGDPNINALIGSSGLRNSIRKAGITPDLLDESNQRVDRLGLREHVKRGGGVPIAVYVDAERNVVKTLKLVAASGDTKATTGEDILAAARR